MSSQQRSLRLLCTLKNAFAVPASHGQAVASGLGRGHAHLWLSSSKVPAVSSCLPAHQLQHDDTSAVSSHNIHFFACSGSRRCSWLASSKQQASAAAVGRQAQQLLLLVMAMQRGG
jgi:hypothetical protein